MHPLCHRIVKLDPDERILAHHFREACAPLSCRALAAAIGKSHESVRRYQLGHTPIPAIVVIRAAAVLEIPVMRIIEGPISTSESR